MMQLQRSEYMFLMAVVAFATICTAVEQPAFQTQGMKFWKALSSSDFDAMASCYASQVIILAGSELQKTEYGINAEGKGNDITVGKNDLLAAYKKFIAKTGLELWKKRLSSIAADKMAFLVAPSDESFCKGVKKGDVMMQVTGEGKFEPFFILRENQERNWVVIMEAEYY